MVPHFIWGLGRACREQQKLSFGHFRHGIFEMPVRCPDGAAEEEV